MSKIYATVNRPKFKKHIRQVDMFSDINRIMPPPTKCSPVETLFIPKINLPVMESQNFYDMIMILIDVSKGTRYATDSVGMYKVSLTLTLMVKQLVDAHKKTSSATSKSFLTDMYIEAIEIIRDYMATAHSVVEFPINYCKCAEGIVVEIGETYLTFLTTPISDRKAFLERVFQYANEFDADSGKEWPKIYHIATVHSIIRLASMYPSDLDCFREMADYAQNGPRHVDFIYREAEHGWSIDFLSMPTFVASKTAISNARKRNRKQMKR